MAPRKRSPKVTKAARSSASDEEDNGATINDVFGSQDSDDRSLKIMAKALKESTNRRRSARRGKIEKDYHRAMEQLETSVTTKLNDISFRTFKLQKSRLESLRVLRKQQASVETDILQGIARLEKAFANANQELQTVLATRIAIEAIKTSE
ncbi:MAG: hypothetical protein Q9178_006342 [Gyalolechia marmorata]